VDAVFTKNALSPQRPTNPYMGWATPPTLAKLGVIIEEKEVMVELFVTLLT
jgi:hypothetical protein